MALHRPTVGPAATAFQDTLRMLLIVATVLLAMVVLTAVFGWNGVAPPVDIRPDPAWPLLF